MGNRNFIVILGSFQSNTFEIVHSIIEFLELPKDIYIPQGEKQFPFPTASKENLALNFFNWSDFSEMFSPFEDETDFANPQNNEHRLTSILMFSPENNLAEPFQQLFNIHERSPLHI
jgi:hypothetical protein